jgi:hypothetical protein
VFATIMNFNINNTLLSDGYIHFVILHALYNMYWEITKFHKQIYCTTVAVPDLPGGRELCEHAAFLTFHSANFLTSNEMCMMFSRFPSKSGGRRTKPYNGISNAGTPHAGI